MALEGGKAVHPEVEARKGDLFYRAVTGLDTVITDLRRGYNGTSNHRQRTILTNIINTLTAQQNLIEMMEAMAADERFAYDRSRSGAEPIICPINGKVLRGSVVTTNGHLNCCGGYYPNHMGQTTDYQGNVDKE